MHMQSWGCISSMSLQALVLKPGVKSLGEGSEGDQGAPPAVFVVIHVLLVCSEVVSSSQVLSLLLKLRLGLISRR